MGHHVVTGGAGTIGSHLVDALLAEGHRVTVLDNYLTGRPENLAHHRGESRLTLIECDVSRPWSIDDDVDAVLHLASPASPTDFDTLPFEIMHVGSRGTEHALNVAQAKGARFLLASTSEVYGDPAITPQPESYFGNVNSIGPRSVYDEAKRYAEAATMAYHRFRGVDTRIVRIFNTYGPRMRQNDGRVLPEFVCRALDGRELRIHGDGKQTRSFGYVSDTVRGILTVLAGDETRPVNVGGDGEISILDFAGRVLKACKSSSSVVHTEAWADDPRRRQPDLTRLRSLGWSASVSFAAGLATTVDWFRAERENQGAPQS